jgi:hypothetical protein
VHNEAAVNIYLKTILLNLIKMSMESIKSALFEKFKFDELAFPEYIRGGYSSTWANASAGTSGRDVGTLTQSTTVQYGTTDGDVCWNYFGMPMHNVCNNLPDLQPGGFTTSTVLSPSQQKKRF